jgi:hypothetical protein
VKKINLVLISLFVFACNRHNSVPKASAFQNLEIIPAATNNALSKHLSAPPQEFIIDLSKDTSIVCKNGTVISFLANSLVDKNGKIANEKINVKVVEVLSLEDFLKNNMNTTSDGKLLESEGMVYLDASCDGKPLTIKKGSEVTIEMPTLEKKSGYKVFNGEYDSLGNMNWKENDKSSIDERMIPLPLDLFTYNYHTKYKFTTERNYVWWMDSLQLQNEKKYENTFVATEEFEQRFLEIEITSIFYWGEYPNGVWWSATETDGTIKPYYRREYGKVYDIFHPVLDIYLANTDKPLWVSDSLAYCFLKKKEINDSIEYYKVNKWNGMNQINYGSFSFQYFLSQHLTSIQQYDPKGVDLSQSNAKELLMKKGLSEREAFNQILIYKSRERIINRRKEVKRLIEEDPSRDYPILKTSSVSFQVKQLGWYSVGKFYNDAFAKEVEFFVDENNDSLDFCDVTLLMPGSSAINAIPIGNGRFVFSKTKDGKSVLPIGGFAYLVAMSSKNNQYYFFQQWLNISEKQDLKINLKKMNQAQLDSSLVDLFKPGQG